MSIDSIPSQPQGSLYMMMKMIIHEYIHNFKHLIFEPTNINEEHNLKERYIINNRFSTDIFLQNVEQIIGIVCVLLDHPDDNRLIYHGLDKAVKGGILYDMGIDFLKDHGVIIADEFDGKQIVYFYSIYAKSIRARWRLLHHTSGDRLSEKVDLLIRMMDGVYTSFITEKSFSEILEDFIN